MVEVSSPGARSKAKQQRHTSIHSIGCQTFLFSLLEVFASSYRVFGQLRRPIFRLDMPEVADVIGDRSELVQQSIVVPVVHEISGNNTAFHFRIVDDPSIEHYLGSFASVVITGPITFELSAPVTSTVAASAAVAVVPDKYRTWPTTRLQVKRLEGAISVKDAILVPAALVIEGNVRQVSTVLSHRTLLDFPPVIVGHLVVAGGTAASETTLTAHVPLALSGVAHRRTW